LNNAKAVNLTDDRHPSQPCYLSSLGVIQRYQFEHHSDLSYLEHSISNLEKAVKLMEEDDTSKAKYLAHLGDSQRTRFEACKDVSDLNSSIVNLQRAIDLTDDRDPHQATYLSGLGGSYGCRFDLLHNPSDLAASISSLRTAAQSRAAYPSQALAAAETLAGALELHSDLKSALEAYYTAFELLPKVAWLGLDASSRQNVLDKVDPEGLGVLAAACAIRLGHFEEAVELLDLGRSVFWQQASSLRSDLKMLREKDVDSQLTNQLDRVGCQLEAGNFSSHVMTDEGDGSSSYRRRTEETVKGRQRLVDEWDELVERVRVLAFEDFLKPMPFRDLRQPFTKGQVVVVIMSRHGIDTLIFGATGPIEHVSLQNVDIHELLDLCLHIALEQPENYSATQKQKFCKRFLQPALRIIWRDVIIPIFDKINIPIVDTPALLRRRIW
jgi:tetratricopeptide (TPR) repeat protein